MITLLTLLTLPMICLSSKFLASDNACFNAVDRNKSTIFNAPIAGTIIGIELIHNSGSVNCDYNNYLYNNWGCQWPTADNPLMVFLEKVTNSISFDGTKYYPTTATNDVVSIKQIGADSNYWFWYNMDPNAYTIDSPQIALLNPTYTVTQAQQFMLQYGEASGQSNVENDGTSCAKVYFIYKEDAVCVSGSTSVDGKYEHFGSHVFYEKSIDQYLYPRQDGSDLSIALTITYKWYISNEMYSAEKMAQCEFGTTLGRYDIDNCNGRWSPESPDSNSMISTNCQDVCISGDYRAGLDGTYTWSHYNVTTRSSVYYCTLCQTYLFLWIFPGGQMNWRIGADYKSPGAWSSCTPDQVVGTIHPDSCSGWFSWYDDQWNEYQSIAAEHCNYYIPSTTTTTKAPTTSTSKSEGGYGSGYDNDDNDDGDMIMMFVGVGILGVFMICAILIAFVKRSSTNNDKIDNTGSVAAVHVGSGTNKTEITMTKQMGSTAAGSTQIGNDTVTTVPVQLAQHQEYAGNYDQYQAEGGHEAEYDEYNNEDNEYNAEPEYEYNKEVEHEYNDQPQEYNNEHEYEYNNEPEPEAEYEYEYNAEPEPEPEYNNEPEPESEAYNNGYNEYNNGYNEPEAVVNNEYIDYDPGVHIVLQGHDMEPMPEYVPEPVPEPMPEYVPEPYIPEPMVMPDPSGMWAEAMGSAVCMI